MGNGIAKLTHCFSGEGRRRHLSAAVSSEPCCYDDSLGHSFCYVRPDPSTGAVDVAGPGGIDGSDSAKVHHSEEAKTTTFRSISGASVSANASTPLSTDLAGGGAGGAAFESSTSFSAVPLQPVPKFSSGPLSGPLSGDRGFMSGPIERGFMSGPLDPRAGLFSGPLERPISTATRLRRTLSSSPRPRRAAAALLRGFTKAIARTIWNNESAVAPIKGSKESDSSAEGNSTHRSSASCRNSVEVSEESGSFDTQKGNLEWAQGRAGEDRVHVVVSEENGWVFVGIYDGFNGPDATDYLLSNLYSAVHRELKGLLWEDKYDGRRDPDSYDPIAINNTPWPNSTAATETAAADGWCREGKQSSIERRKVRGPAKKWEENHRRWKCEWDRERSQLDRTLKEQLRRTSSCGAVNHLEVLKALSQALRKTEEAYLEIADKMVSENPELALMGSCVLVMLMKGEDVYVMNVGDSRAILAQKAEPEVWGLIGQPRQDLERIKEENFNDLEATDGGDPLDGFLNLAALQLTLDHNTCVEEEVRRIKKEHPDDASAITNDRVKGSLKVTRAFGAGFLKQPKWNNALLEVFRIDYIGSSPYITCSPSLYHHKLGPEDKFLILSSDGLYQYFTNEEAVAQVELFIAATPEGDPAQHLVEEVLFRAAEKAGMDFHELLEIPQGDRRRYHDDVSIIVISLEGRIWRSSV